MEAQPKEEEEKHNLETLILHLFDLYWFRRLILYNRRPSPPPPTLPPPAPASDADELPSPAGNLGHRRVNHRRSLSDDLTPTPTDRPITGIPKLQTILSGKEEAAAGEEIPIEGQEQRWRGRRDRRRRRRRRRRRSEGSKSMSELEFEELKGFMDLGFTFSEAETDPRLMEIVPGLQRMRASDDGSSSSVDDMAAPRPYLSEAWEAAKDEEEIQNRLMGVFKIPTDSVGDGDGLKNQLRFWAHAVASPVR